MSISKGHRRPWRNWLSFRSRWKKTLKAIRNKLLDLEDNSNKPKMSFMRCIMGNKLEMNKIETNRIAKTRTIRSIVGKREQIDGARQQTPRSRRRRISLGKLCKISVLSSRRSRTEGNNWIVSLMIFYSDAFPIFRIK